MPERKAAGKPIVLSGVGRGYARRSSGLLLCIFRAESDMIRRLWNFWKKGIFNLRYLDLEGEVQGHVTGQQPIRYDGFSASRFTIRAHNPSTHR